MSLDRYMSPKKAAEMDKRLCEAGEWISDQSFNHVVKAGMELITYENCATRSGAVMTLTLCRKDFDYIRRYEEAMSE